MRCFGFLNRFRVPKNQVLPTPNELVRIVNQNEKESNSTSIDHLKQTLRCMHDKVSCIYVFELGKVSVLRHSMQIPSHYDNNSSVIKFGRTNDLVRRATEHLKTYSGFEGVNLRLLKFLFISNEFTPEAERRIKHFFVDNLFPFKTFKELAVLKPTDLRYLNNAFDSIRDICSLRVDLLVSKIAHLERENASKSELITALKSNSAITNVSVM